MLQVVADKTGYPVEMLELSMALEADLGIDSIKRVEILSAVQQRVPSLPEVETSAMAELKTLQEIVDYLNTLLPAKAPSSNGAVNGGVNGNGNGNGQRSGPPLSPVSSGSVVSAPVTATAVGTDL
ncbi:phosphopantetheine-binding protein, partial [Mycobacterium intermedium]